MSRVQIAFVVILGGWSVLRSYLWLSGFVEAILHSKLILERPLSSSLTENSLCGHYNVFSILDKPITWMDRWDARCKSLTLLEYIDSGHWSHLLEQTVITITFYVERIFNFEICDFAICEGNAAGEHVLMVKLFYKSIMITVQQIVNKLFLSVVVACTQMHCA